MCFLGQPYIPVSILDLSLCLVLYVRTTSLYYPKCTATLATCEEVLSSKRALQRAPYHPVSSLQGLFQEMSLATHLGVPAILVNLSNSCCINLARCLHRSLLNSSQIVRIHIACTCRPYTCVMLWLKCFGCAVFLRIYDLNPAS